MATISYQLRPAYASNYGGGVVFVDNFRSFDVKAALTSGSGTIIADASDSALIIALDNYPPLYRVGSNPGASPPATNIREALVVRRTSPANAGEVPVLQADGTWVSGAASSIGTDPNAIPKSVVTTKGDLLAATGNAAPVRLGVGANNSVLVADSTQASGVAWSAAPGGAVLATIVDAKGDLLVGTAADTVSRLPVGTNGQILVADSTQSAGVKWGPPASGSAHGIQDEGVALTQRSGLNFIGSAITATDQSANDRTNVTVLITDTLQFTQLGSAIIATSVDWRAPTAGTITRVGLTTQTAPIGSNLVVNFKKNGTTFQTLTITAGTTTEQSAALTTAYSAADKLAVETTSVGSTTAAQNVAAQIDYQA